MVYIPATILGRGVLASIIALYIFLLILNLVSFGGLQWIMYTDYNLQFGLWRVCYGAVSATRTCSQWSSDSNTVDSATNAVIFSGKPGFIQAAQGLEITSIILYIIAGVLIILGIIDLAVMPLETMFLAAAALLFLTIIFLSAALGVMSVQGRSNHPGAYLDWAWWIGLLGLIVTIICVVLIIVFILDIYQTNTPKMNNGNSFTPQRQNWSGFAPMIAGSLAYPPPYSSYPSYNQWPTGYPVPAPASSPPPFYPNYPYPSYGGMFEPPASPLLASLARQQLANIRRF
ncbi:unnamed protein product [Adineta ricciae]|uniref:Uncharacterized protein n=1 Tax=Adineta ricciae TaxID=249248 RepID=A0A814BC16_ADIRI|nr:unnamed protein product [Adineta ricciae]